MSELKPCPFCGTNNAELRHDKDGFLFVICVKDGCYCRTDGHLNEKAAVEAWNRRAEPLKEQTAADVVEVVRCNYCKDNATGCVSKGTIWCERYHARRPIDGYCSYGEQKGEYSNA